MPEDAHLIIHVDDLGIVVTAKDVQSLQLMAEYTSTMLVNK